jgi:hypothetical protein
MRYFVTQSLYIHQSSNIMEAMLYILLLMGNIKKGITRSTSIIELVFVTQSN